MAAADAKRPWSANLAVHEKWCDFVKKISLNEWLAVATNLAVIIGIVFLAIEIRQNNQLLRAEAVSALLETRMVRNQEVFSNQSIALLLAKNERNEQLTDDDLIRLQAGFSRTLMGWQRDFFLYEEGLLSESYIRTNLAVMKETLSPNAVGTYTHFDLWDQGWKVLAAPTYREFVERCVLADCVEF